MKSIRNNLEAYDKLEPNLYIFQYFQDEKWITERTLGVMDQGAWTANRKKVQYKYKMYPWRLLKIILQGKAQADDLGNWT